MIVMLGTNDVKERLGANAACIALGMDRLVRKAQSVDCWGNRAPNILIRLPPRHPAADGGQPLRRGHGEGVH